MRNEQETSLMGMRLKDLLLYYAPPFAATGFIVSSLGHKYFEALASGDNTAPWFITAGVICFIGTIVDTASTVRVMETAIRADMASVKHHIVETNPFLPDRPTPQDLLRGGGLTQDIAFELFGIAFPPLGIGVGTGRILGAISNTHFGRSLEGEIEKINRLRRAKRKPITNIEDARNILHAVVSVGNDSITPQTPTDRVAGFPFRRIRESIAVVGTDLISRYTVEENEQSFVMGKPLRGDVDAILTFSKLGRRKIVYDDDRYWSIELDAGPLHAEVPLQISNHMNDVSFTDDRARYSRRVFPSNLRESLSVTDHRRLLRGMRWVCANIMEWEKPGFIMPNDLSTLYSK